MVKVTSASVVPPEMGSEQVPGELVPQFDLTTVPLVSTWESSLFQISLERIVGSALRL